jgi:glycosyltransferase involved in cell wall biosynthesis
MHVMQVIDSLYGGGAETSLLEVIPGLESRGVNISLVTLQGDDGALEKRLSDLGVPRTRLRRSDPLGLTLELRDVIRSERPDLVHTTLLFSNLVGRVAARTVHVPVVTTLANQDYGPEHRANSRYGPWSVRAVHAAELMTAPLTTRFHAVSNDVARAMSHRLRISADRIRVVYRGRDPARLGSPTLSRRRQTRAALGIGPDTPVVLSVGRLDRQKGVETTVEAFHRVTARIPQAVLLVAGRPGNAYTPVQAAIGNSPAIRLLGHREDVPDLMCAADVLSFPSRWEGLGGTLIEAMALRVGIVASDIPAIAEAMGDVDWPLVKPDDGGGLAEGLLSVLEGGTVSEARKDAGERRFQRLFTADAASEGMASLYLDVLRGTRSRP